MKPNDALHPGVPPQAEQWLKDAVALGFRFLRAPRIGMPRPEFLIKTNAYAAELDVGQIDHYHKVSREVEARGAGIAAPEAIGVSIKQRIGSAEPWFAVLDQSQDIHEERAIERSIGEWADGDTVAAHLGYGCDVLCTED